MQRWEYRQEIFQGIEAMNKWGDDGWEFVTGIGKDGAFLILKRPLKGSGASSYAAAASSSASPSAGGPAAPAGKPKKEFI